MGRLRKPGGKKIKGKLTQSEETYGILGGMTCPKAELILSHNCGLKETKQNLLFSAFVKKKY